MVTGNILEESCRWQFINSMLDCTLNCLTEGGGGVWEVGVNGGVIKSSKLNKRGLGVRINKGGLENS